MKIYNRKWFGKHDELKPKMGAMMYRVNESYIEEYLEKRLDKDVLYVIDSIQEKYWARDFKQLISRTNFEINAEEINDIIKSYELPHGSGVGMVVIAECLNKPEKYATSIVTIFDIDTRALLWVVKMKGIPDGYGIEAYGWEGFKKSFGYWLSKFYDKEKKEYLKLNKS